MGGLFTLLRTPQPRSDTRLQDFFRGLSGTPVVSDPTARRFRGGCAGFLRRPAHQDVCRSASPTAGGIWELGWAPAATRRYPPLTTTRWPYSLLLAPTRSDPASRGWISLLGRRSWRYWLFDHGTRSSSRPATIWVGVGRGAGHAIPGSLGVTPHEPGPRSARGRRR